MSSSLTDWTKWHEPYANPYSPLSLRRRTIQNHLQDWLDTTAPRTVRVLSLCAGDGRDLIEVLHGRDDTERVQAVLVELDSDLVARARHEIHRVGLSEVVQVRGGDAADPRLYADVCPADLVLLAGVFGNITDDHVRQTIRCLPMLCAPGARAIWTRHHKTPDLTGRIRDWLAAEKFDEQSFTAPQDAIFSVGVHDFTGDTERWSPPPSLFTFIR